MKTKQFKKVIDRYLKGKSTSKDQDLLNTLFESNKKDKIPLDAGIVPHELKAEMIINIKAEINRQKLLTLVNQNINKQSSKKKLYLKIAASVIFFVVVSLTIFYFNEFGANPKMETVVTGNGQHQELQLKDGTSLVLNANSSLSYPSFFEGNSREVFLEGEAFFNVTKNPEKPFIIHTGSVKTTVLGTSFNVRTIEDQDVEVTVVSGKVNVSCNMGANVNLLSEDRVIFDLNRGAYSIDKVDSKNYLIWMERRLDFDKITFSEAMETIERVYNVEIEIVNTASDDCVIRTKYIGKSLTDVLNGMKLLVNFDFRWINDKAIEITIKGCQ